jgi:hypothetical protein
MAIGMAFGYWSLAKLHLERAHIAMPVRHFPIALRPTAHCKNCRILHSLVFSVLSPSSVIRKAFPGL